MIMAKDSYYYYFLETVSRSPGCPPTHYKAWISGFPASMVLGLQACVITPDGYQTQGFLHARRAFYQLSWTPKLISLPFIYFLSYFSFYHAPTRSQGGASQSHAYKTMSKWGQKETRGGTTEPGSVLWAAPGRRRNTEPGSVLWAAPGRKRNTEPGSVSWAAPGRGSPVGWGGSQVWP